MTAAHDYDPTHATKRRVKATPPEAVDIAIVGAGLGGLVCGAYLAKQGLKVAVFDQHYVAGGCCTQFSRGGPRHRYNFDIGLHYIGDCGPDGYIPRILERLGLSLDYVPMDQDGFDTLVFPDFRFRIPADHGIYRDRLVEMFPGERKGIDRYVRFLKEVDGLSRRLNASQGKVGWGMAAQALFRGRLASRYSNGTIAEFLDTCTDDIQLRAVMLGQNGDYGLPPSKVSAMLHAGLANHYFHGAFYPRGGGQMIADVLAQSIEDHGGSVHLRRGIERILIEDGRAVGVRTETYKKQQFEVRARAVVSNADLKLTLDHLLEPTELPEKWREREQNLEMAAAIFMTCLGIRGDMRSRGMTNTNYWQFDGYDFEAFYRTEDMQPRGCYITSGSLKDPDTPHHAPEGIQTVEAMTVLPGRSEFWSSDGGDPTTWSYKKNQRYKDLKARIQDEMIQRVDALFPGSAENVDFVESASPMSHTRYTRATDGTGYGLACTPEQFMGNRPGYRGPFEQLYLTGASTRAGHGVLGSMLSGYRSARRVAQQFEVELPEL